MTFLLMVDKVFFARIKKLLIKMNNVNNERSNCAI